MLFKGVDTVVAISGVLLKTQERQIVIGKWSMSRLPLIKIGQKGKQNHSFVCMDLCVFFSKPGTQGHSAGNYYSHL